MKAVHNRPLGRLSVYILVIAHVKLQNESSSQRYTRFNGRRHPCDCSRKITK